MSALRNALAAIAIAIASVGPASSTDFTDLWWDPAESGWGLNIAHQAETIYITLYVYGATTRATWYSATLHFAGSDASGSLVYTGDLFEATGPWFGGVLFDPGLVTIRRAGDATFRGTSVDTGTLSYSVDGIVVDKAIERFTLALMNLSGEYIGGIVQTNFNCMSPALNGTLEDAAFISVVHTGTNVDITTSSTRRTCTYRGTYAQAGRMGNINDGSFTCSDGAAGTFAAFEINASTSGLLARFFGTGDGCSFNGDIAGALR
jgi:hypothetical protein